MDTCHNPNKSNFTVSLDTGPNLDPFVYMALVWLCQFDISYDFQFLPKIRKSIVVGKLMRCKSQLCNFLFLQLTNLFHENAAQSFKLKD